MVGIVFDKLMQYQIVDPNDVVGWTFTNGAGLGLGSSSSLNGFEWGLVRGALDKANGRVLIARRKITALRKEEDDTRARTRANESMEVDADAKPGMSCPMMLCRIRDTDCRQKQRMTRRWIVRH